MNKLVADVEEYLHWRKVNPHIKGGENYLKRMRDSLSEHHAEPDSVSIAQVWDRLGRKTPKKAIQFVLDAAGVNYHDDIPAGKDEHRAEPISPSTEAEIAEVGRSLDNELSIGWNGEPLNISDTAKAAITKFLEMRDVK